MHGSETSHILESLILDHAAVRFGHAVMVIETGGAEEFSWWVAIFDAEPQDFGELKHEVAICATTKGGTRLAGRAVVDCVTPACRFVGLRGVGPVLVG